MSILTPRLNTARKQVQQLAFALTYRTIQRNTIKDQRDRLLSAVEAVNHANAYAPSLREARLKVTIDNAIALGKVVREYDALQQSTDTTYPVQEN